MEAILKYNLPDDQAEFQMAMDAGKMHSVLWDMDQWLRAQIKYAPDEMSQEKYEAFEECREKLHDLMVENNVDLD